VPANGQAFLDYDATARADLAGVGRGHGYSSLPSICSFESEDGAELTPARVTDGLGEMVVLHHVGNLQVFVVYRIVALHQGARGFMLMIEPLPSHLQMLLGKQIHTLAASVAALLATGDTPLGTLERFLGLPVVAWVLDVSPISQRQEGFQPDIDACLFPRQGQGLYWHLGTRETDIPAIRFFGDRDGFGCAFQGARPTHGKMSTFGEQQPISYQTGTIPPLRIGERPVAVPSLEAWIPGLLACLDPTKEGFEGPINTQYDILQHLGVERRAVFSKLAYLWQLGLLLIIPNRYVPHLPGISAFLQRGIVEFSAETKRGFKLRGLRGRWAQFVLEGFVSRRLWHRFVAPFTFFSIPFRSTVGKAERPPAGGMPFIPRDNEVLPFS
jgi:hypothetical protein